MEIHAGGTTLVGWGGGRGANTREMSTSTLPTILPYLHSQLDNFLLYNMFRWYPGSYWPILRSVDNLHPAKCWKRWKDYEKPRGKRGVWKGFTF